MIICNECGFKSLDFEHFSARLTLPPRGLKIESSLSENDRRFIQLKTKYLFFKCPACGETFTSKPDERTEICLQKRKESDNDSEKA